MFFAHRAALVPQLAVTQQALALLDQRVSLLVVQILQLVDVVLALGLSLLHVDVRQHALHDGDLHTRGIKAITFCVKITDLKDNVKVLW